MPYGSFNEDANLIWDFVRCQRPDGTFYGTSGKCKSGSEVGAKEIAAAKPKKAAAKKALAEATPEQLQKLVNHPKMSPAQKKVIEGEIAKKTGTAKKSAAPKAEKPAPKKVPAAITNQEKKVAELEAKAKGPGGSKFVDKWKAAKEKLEQMKEKAGMDSGNKSEEKLLSNYQKLAKKQQELVSAGKIKEAEKLAPKVKSAYEEWEKASNSRKETEEKAKKLIAEREAEQKEWNDRQKKLDQRQWAAVRKLNQRDFDAIKDYTGEGTESGRSYNDLNQCLRKKTPCLKPKVVKHAAELDAALKKMPGNTDGDPFFRGFPVGVGTLKLYETLKNAQPGTVIKDPGFGSYSSSKDVAKGFQTGQKNIMFVNRNKDLRPINTVSSIPDEYEAIMPRGVKSTIRKVTEDDKGNLIVELD